MATPAELTAYRERLLKENERIDQALAKALGTTSNRSVEMQYRALAQQKKNTLKSYLDHTDRLIKAASPKTAAGTSPEAKAQAAADALDPQAKLAENRKKITADLNTSTAPALAAGGSGIVDALKSGSGVPNYTLDSKGNPIGKPYSVTLAVPKSKEELKDPEAIAAEKQRLIDRKDLDKSVGGLFISKTGKPLTSDVVFGGAPLTWDPKTGERTDKTGIIAPGLDEATYKGLWKKYQDSTPQMTPKDRELTKSVEIPADQYEKMLGQFTDIQGPGAVVPRSAIAKDLEARAMVQQPELQNPFAAPADALTLPETSRRAPLVEGGGIQPQAPITAVPTVPRLGGAPALERMTRGMPLNALGIGDQQSFDDRLAESAGATNADILRKQQADQLAYQQAAMKDLGGRQQIHNIAKELGFGVRPDEVAAILSTSPNPLIKDPSQIPSRTGQTFDLELLAKSDPARFAQLMAAKAKNTSMEAGVPSMDAVDANMATAGGVGSLLTDPMARLKAANRVLSPYYSSPSAPLPPSEMFVEGATQPTQSQDFALQYP